MNLTEIASYKDGTVVANFPHSSVDPYSLLDHCDNVEREGSDSYRFDGVVPDMKNSLVSILTFGVKPGSHYAFE